MSNEENKRIGKRRYRLVVCPVCNGQGTGKTVLNVCKRCKGKKLIKKRLEDE